MLNDDVSVAQTSELVVGNNNVALCPFVRLLQAYRLLGVGAEILWRPGLEASYGMLILCVFLSSGALLLACEQHYEEAHISCEHTHFSIYIFRFVTI
jgi:hypothetical protein